jgi:hypothetical protein
VLGYYINLIIEYLVSSFIWKINGSEYFLKSFQNKLILNFAYNRSFHRWFSFYNYKKEYFVNNFFYNYKKNINNEYILYNYNNNAFINFSYNVYTKESYKNIIEYINNNNILTLQNNNNLEKSSLLDINHNNNNININDSYNFFFFKEYDISNILELEKKKYIGLNIFNYKNFFYNKLNFLVQSNLEKKDTYPLEVNNFVLKALLKKDLLNYNKFINNNNDEENLKLYDNYILNYKKKLLFYNSIYDLLLLQSKWKILNLIKFNDLLYNNNNKIYFYNSLIKFITLNDFIKILNIEEISKFILKIDLFLVRWEENTISIKKKLMQEFFTPNNFSIKKVLKNIIVNAHNSFNKKLLINFKEYNYSKLKKFSNAKSEEYIDYIELYIKKAFNNNIFKKKFFKYNIFKKEENYCNNNRKFLHLDFFVLKKQLEEFVYKNYSLRLKISINDLENILYNNYIIIEDKIFEINIKKNIVQVISLEEYQKKLYKIKLYNAMFNNKDIFDNQKLFKSLQEKYYDSKNLINKFFNKNIYKNKLIKKMIYYNEHKLFLFNKKDKLVLHNNMERIINFFSKQDNFNKKSNVNIFYNFVFEYMKVKDEIKIKNNEENLVNENIKKINYIPKFIYDFFNEGDSSNSKFFIFLKLDSWNLKQLVQISINLKNSLIKWHDNNNNILEYIITDDIEAIPVFENQDSSEEITEFIEITNENKDNFYKKFVIDYDINENDLQSIKAYYKEFNALSKFEQDLVIKELKRFIELCYDTAFFMENFKEEENFEFWIYKTSLLLYKKEFYNFKNNKYFLNYNDDYFSKFNDLKINFKEMKDYIELIYNDYDIQEYKEFKEWFNLLNNYSNLLDEYNRLFSEEASKNITKESFEKKLWLQKNFLDDNNAEIATIMNMISLLKLDDWQQLSINILDNNILLLDLQKISRITQIYSIYLNELWQLHYKICKQIELQDKLLDQMDLDFENRLNTIDEFTKNIRKNCFNLNYLNKFYIKYYIDLPFIKSEKYFNILKVENSLKYNNWELYKLKRLNIEHWNKNFKDYNNINSFKLKNKYS